MELPPLILASASPRRAQLFRQLELVFEIVPAQCEETSPEHLTPREIALLNAWRKARVVAKSHPDSLVMAADTVVCLGLTVYGKPGSIEEAHRFLAQLEGRTHEVITGVCLLHLRAHRQRMFAAATEVTFRRLDALAIRNYVSLIDPLDKAGAYAIQEHGELLVESIRGSFSNVVGLPLEQVYGELRHWNRQA